MARTPSEVCRNGHPMSGDNLLWHTRYDDAGTQFLVRECRSCANQRYRTKRSAIRRNQELEKAALASIHAQPTEEFADIA
jgi:hypothetical protein